MSEPAVSIQGATPILYVAALEASLAYYTERLGFTVAWAHPSRFACVQRGACRLFLCEGDQGHPGGWVWIGVSDAGEFEKELLVRGASIRRTATNFEWAYELQVQDPDGNVLRFASDPKPDQPLGEFLDMHGKLWPTSG